jgi:hypothetical protein
MFQMVLIHRRSYLAGFWGSVGLDDAWTLETSGMPISLERGAQENVLGRIAGEQTINPMAYRARGVFFADKKGQEGIAFTYNRQHQALLTSV